MEKLNLFQKLSRISDKVGYVAKNIDINVGATKKYKAVGELDVISAVKPLEIEFGIFSYPIKHEVIETKELEKANGRVEQFVRVQTTYRFVDIDNPSDYIETTALGDGVDSGDKASGKAQTYADKYALLKTYKIMTGDDPDLEPSAEYKKKGHAPADVFASDEVRVQALNEIVALLGNDQSKVAQWFKHYEINHNTITPSIANKIITRIKEKQNA